MHMHLVLPTKSTGLKALQIFDFCSLVHVLGCVLMYHFALVLTMICSRWTIRHLKSHGQAGSRNFSMWLLQDPLKLLQHYKFTASYSNCWS